MVSVTICAASISARQALPSSNKVGRKIAGLQLGAITHSYAWWVCWAVRCDSHMGDFQVLDHCNCCIAVEAQCELNRCRCCSFPPLVVYVYSHVDCGLSGMVVLLWNGAMQVDYTGLGFFFCLWLYQIPSGGLGYRPSISTEVIPPPVMVPKLAWPAGVWWWV